MGVMAHVGQAIVPVVVIVPPVMGEVVAIEVTVPLPPPPPPLLLADAAEDVIVAKAVPVTVAEARIRIPVNPAVFTCQVPLLVVEVTAVVELSGNTLRDDHVVPPSPVASNCIVPVQVPDRVSVAPPLSSGRLTTRHRVDTEQSDPLVVILPLVAQRGREAKISIVSRHRFILPPKTEYPMTTGL